MSVRRRIIGARRRGAGRYRLVAGRLEPAIGPAAPSMVARPPADPRHHSRARPGGDHAPRAPDRRRAGGAPSLLYSIGWIDGSSATWGASPASSGPTGTGAAKVPQLPVRLWIESTSRCNLKCGYCPNKDVVKEDHGFMDFGLFTSIIDQVSDHAYDVNLFHRGEPLMHPTAPRHGRLRAKQGPLHAGPHQHHAAQREEGSGPDRVRPRLPLVLLRRIREGHVREEPGRGEVRVGARPPEGLPAAQA